MEKQEVVKMVLELSGCQSSKSISAMAMRKFGLEKWLVLATGQAKNFTG